MTPPDGLLRSRDVPGAVPGRAWVVPAGTTGKLSVDGGGAGDDKAPELMWSERASAIPSTRAVVILGPVRSDVTSVDFGRVHRIAEDVAADVSELDGEEVGPIEVLVFSGADRGSEGDVAPTPVSTATGAEFRFVNGCGARVLLTLSIPQPDTGEEV